MTRPRLILTLLGLTALLAGALVFGRHESHHPSPPPQESRAHAMEEDELLLPEDMALVPSFEVISLSQAAQIIEDRFEGKLIAARLVPPFAEEWQDGVALVHELRLLSPKRHVLMIRLDARTGRFLDVAGAGLAEARKHPGKNQGKTK